ncbi:MAG: carbonic anhydrase [Bdellovibrionales bacterium]
MADQTNNLIERLKAGEKKAREVFEKNPGLHSGQKPKIAVVGCSDSRVPTDVLFDAKPGEVFTFRNIGNSLEDETDPTQLSPDAKKFITYANHLGVETLVILPHGKCGCIANACNCASGHAHGHGLEADILKDMGDKKKFAVDLVKKEGAASYLTSRGLPADSNSADAHLQAVEIAHGLIMAGLARNLLKELNSTMSIALVYYNVATCDAYISPRGDGKFQKVSGNNVNPAPQSKHKPPTP